MKFKELSKFWKRTIITLSALTVIFALIFGSLVGFLTNMHTENEVLRNTLKKPDSELIGQRLVIERKGKGDIYANVYIDDRGGLIQVYNELLTLIEKIEKGEIRHE